MKMKTTISLLALILFAGHAWGQESTAEFAEYGVNLGLSPFGPSLGFTHNLSEKTSVQIAVGAFEGDNPANTEVGGYTFEGTAETNWMGIFVNHRPFEDQDWFRLNAGIGIGGIEGTITDVDNAEHTYHARWDNNPVGYVGVGVGGRPVQGITVALDLGALHTAGPDITATGTFSDSAVLDELPSTFGFGRVLPNFQLSVGYGF